MSPEPGGVFDAVNEALGNGDGVTMGLVSSEERADAAALTAADVLEIAKTRLPDVLDADEGGRDRAFVPPNIVCANQRTVEQWGVILLPCDGYFRKVSEATASTVLRLQAHAAAVALRVRREVVLPAGSPGAGVDGWAICVTAVDTSGTVLAEVAPIHTGPDAVPGRFDWVGAATVDPDLLEALIAGLCNEHPDYTGHAHVAAFQEDPGAPLTRARTYVLEHVHREDRDDAAGLRCEGLLELAQASALELTSHAQPDAAPAGVTGTGLLFSPRVITANAEFVSVDEYREAGGDGGGAGLNLAWLRHAVAEHAFVVGAHAAALVLPPGYAGADDGGAAAAGVAVIAVDFAGGAVQECAAVVELARGGLDLGRWSPPGTLDAETVTALRGALVDPDRGGVRSAHPGSRRPFATVRAAGADPSRAHTAKGGSESAAESGSEDSSEVKTRANAEGPEGRGSDLGREAAVGEDLADAWSLGELAELRRQELQAEVSALAEDGDPAVCVAFAHDDVATARPLELPDDPVERNAYLVEVALELRKRAPSAVVFNITMVDKAEGQDLVFMVAADTAGDHEIWQAVIDRRPRQAPRLGPWQRLPADCVSGNLAGFVIAVLDEPWLTRRFLTRGAEGLASGIFALLTHTPAEVGGVSGGVELIPRLLGRATRGVLDAPELAAKMKQTAEEILLLGQGGYQPQLLYAIRDRLYSQELLLPETAEEFRDYLLRLSRRLREQVPSAVAIALTFRPEDGRPPRALVHAAGEDGHSETWTAVISKRGGRVELGDWGLTSAEAGGAYAVVVACALDNDLPGNTPDPDDDDGRVDAAAEPADPAAPGPSPAARGERSDEEDGELASTPVHRLREQPHDGDDDALRLLDLGREAAAAAVAQARGGNGVCPRVLLADAETLWEYELPAFATPGHGARGADEGLSAGEVWHHLLAVLAGLAGLHAARVLAIVAAERGRRYAPEDGRDGEPVVIVRVLSANSAGEVEEACAEVQYENGGVNGIGDWERCQAREPLRTGVLDALAPISVRVDQDVSPGSPDRALTPDHTKAQPERSRKPARPRKPAQPRRSRRGAGADAGDELPLFSFFAKPRSEQVADAAGLARLQRAFYDATVPELDAGEDAMPVVAFTTVDAGYGAELEFPVEDRQHSLYCFRLAEEIAERDASAAALGVLVSKPPPPGKKRAVAGYYVVAVDRSPAVTRWWAPVSTRGGKRKLGKWTETNDILPLYEYTLVMAMKDPELLASWQRQYGVPGDWPQHTPELLRPPADDEYAELEHHPQLPELRRQGPAIWATRRAFKHADALKHALAVAAEHDPRSLPRTALSCADATGVYALLVPDGQAPDYYRQLTADLARLELYAGAISMNVPARDHAVVVYAADSSGAREAWLGQIPSQPGQPLSWKPVGAPAVPYPFALMLLIALNQTELAEEFIRVHGDPHALAGALARSNKTGKRQRKTTHRSFRPSSRVTNR
jgi:hypothetical protein